MRLTNWIYTLPLKLRSLFRRRQIEQELADELRDHIESKTAEHLARGMNPAEARRAALLKLGGVEQTKEACRDHLRWALLDSLLQDLRFAAHCVYAKPGFATIAVLTLALGVGASTAVFSVVDRVLFRSLPYPHDEQLVSFGVKAPFEGIEFMLAPEYLVLRKQPGPFESVTSLTPGGADCDITEQNPLRLACALVQANFLSTLQIHPIVAGISLPKTTGPTRHESPCSRTPCGARDSAATQRCRGESFLWMASHCRSLECFPPVSKCPH